MKKVLALLCALALMAVGTCVFAEGKTGDAYLGCWQDEVSRRASLEIWKGERAGVYIISIDWGSSASETSGWYMEARLDESGALAYTDGIKTNVSYDENGESLGGEIEFEDSVGKLTLGEDGKITWTDDKEALASGCRFVFLCEGEPRPVSLADIQLEPNLPGEYDLDGDGTIERLTLECTDEYGNASLAVDGESSGVRAGLMLSMPQCYVADIDGDGRKEIFVTGDLASEDYVTCCYHYINGDLVSVLFMDLSGAVNLNNPSYVRLAFGRLTAISDNHIDLTGYISVLGTWQATRGMTLSGEGLFEPDDNGYWNRADRDAPDLWDEGSAITVKEKLAYYGVGENGEGTLGAGTKLVIVATDMNSIAWFITEDGPTGSFEICEDYVAGYGWTVGGVPEHEVFSDIHYAG